MMCVLLYLVILFGKHLYTAAKHQSWSQTKVQLYKFTTKLDTIGQIINTHTQWSSDSDTLWMEWYSKVVPLKLYYYYVYDVQDCIWHALSVYTHKFL